MNDLVLIGKNLFRKKLRAALMLVSILIAFLIFGVLAGFERAFNAGEDVAAADRLVVVNKINFTQPLPIAYFNRVRGIEGVRQVTHFNWFGGYYQEPKNFLIVMAVEPETYMQVYNDQIDIPADARQAFLRERPGALVGETMLKKWGWKVGDRVPIMSNIGPQAQRRHQLHGVPPPVLQRDPDALQGSDRLDGPQHHLPIGQRSGGQDHRPDVRQLLL